MMMPMDGGYISQLNEGLRRIVVSGTICELSASMFLEQITAFEFMDTQKPVTIYIDTFGGCVDSALLMYDAMKTCSMPVLTVGVGKVMSAGTLLLAAGEKDSRFITENCRVMLHQISGGMMGTMSELQNSLEETKRLQDIYLSIMSKETGVPKHKILSDISSGDFYMSAPEAIAYGLCDHIVLPRKNAKVAKKAAKKARK